MLGERIRKLRKQKKMTLEALAGESLTKGMLSLIENNKANPSMDSLAYIAQRLEVDISDLLDERDTEELRAILEKAEGLLNTELEKPDGKFKPIIHLIKPLLPTLSEGYESARLLDIYSRCLYREDEAGWERYAKKASGMYDQMNLTSRRAQIGILRALVRFVEHDYEKALRILLEERKAVESTHVHIDPTTKLNFDYHESIFYYAVGNTEDAIAVMEEAISYSREHQIYYRINDLYRLASAHHILSGQIDQFEHYAKKLKQYGEFADDPLSLHFIELLEIRKMIFYEHKYEEALHAINHYMDAHNDETMINIVLPYFHLEKGNTLLHLGQHEEAIEQLQTVEVPKYIHHPFDLALFYIKDAYIAKSYLALGNRKLASAHAKTAYERFQPLPDSPLKTIVLDTYSYILGLKS